ncbi:Uncharacterised protein g10528 [Pycnogonum litorale]
MNTSQYLLSSAMLLLFCGVSRVASAFGICTEDGVCQLTDEHSHCNDEGKCVCNFGYTSDSSFKKCELFLDQNILIGIGVGAAVVIIVVIVACVCCCKRRG